MILTEWKLVRAAPKQPAENRLSKKNSGYVLRGYLPDGYSLEKFVDISQN